MRMRRNQLWVLILFVITLFFTLPVQAQVTVGDQTAPHPFSVLELTTSKVKGGLRLPQLTTQQRNDLNLTSAGTDAKGLVIYNTDDKSLQYWNGATWISFNLPPAPSSSPQENGKVKELKTNNETNN